jgi:hypothetical protein
LLLLLLLSPSATPILRPIWLLATLSSFGRNPVRGFSGKPLLLLRSSSRLDPLGPRRRLLHLGRRRSRDIARR